MTVTRRQFLNLLPGPAAWAIGMGAHSKSPAQTTDTGERRPILIDADTANEVDDLFAIVRALIEPGFNVVGLTSAQWHTSSQAPNDSVSLSQQMNEDILRLLDITNVPHPIGSNIPLVNQYRPQQSPASDHIIAEALKVPDDQKLSVCILGPCTNLASAILIEPAIIPKIDCYYLGFWHDVAQGTWSKREFNSNNDPNAVDALLNTAGLEFHVMTATSSKALVYQKTVVDRHLKGKGGIGDYLVNRWETYRRTWMADDPDKRRWVMWDVAIIEALAKPAYAKQEQVDTPHDNRLRKISAYTSIDAEAMQADYWRAVDTLF